MAVLNICVEQGRLKSAKENGKNPPVYVADMKVNRG